MKIYNIKGKLLKEIEGNSLQNAYLRNANLQGADLRRADLQEANLQGVNFRWCIGNGREIKTLLLDTYHINYTHDRMSIGCELHPIEDWHNFSDDRISEMDNGALEWWKEWKEFIFTAIEKSPC